MKLSPWTIRTNRKRQAAGLCAKCKAERASDSRWYCIRCREHVRTHVKSVKFRKAVLRRDGYRCRYCGSRARSMEVDHVVPISKGGTNSLDNLVAACPKCNASKGSAIGWKKSL